MFDYIIVGAGLAGSVCAERLAVQKNKKILIIEKRRHIAGNCYDYKDENNILIHKYGPHLFHTNNKEVFEYLSGFSEWDVYNHKVMANIDGQNIPIPFNLNSLYLAFPRVLAEKIEIKLIERYKYNSKVPILELKQNKDKDLKFLADYVYQKIFVYYTSKQWGMSPEEIDKEVTARVPVFIGRDNRYFNDKYQVVPKNGYTKLVENMLNNKNIKIMLNTSFSDICSLDCELKEITFMGHKFNGKIIYTGQIDELFNYKFGILPYRSVKMNFESINAKVYQETATINYPDSYNFTRITEFKHIHPVNAKKTTILKEYPEEYKKGINLPYYPVLTKENQKKYNLYKEYSKQFNNIFLLGRLAEYKYYDMDDIVEKALRMSIGGI